MRINNIKKTKCKKPCSGCPFKRENTLDGSNPGGSHPFVYIGQSRGPFWLPCHNDKNYKDKDSDPESVSECRGAAIFRSNCEIPHKLPDNLLKLEKDKENVFANEREFLENYMYLSEGELINLTRTKMLDLMLKSEMDKVIKINKEKE